MYFQYIPTIIAILHVPEVLLYEFENLGVKNLYNYGPYELVLSNYEVCKGPKLRNSAIMQMAITKDINQDYILRSNITFLENSEINQIRIKALLIKGNNKKSTLLNYMVDKPCEHFVMSALIEKHLNAKKCFVKKGTYSFEFNYSDALRKFFGDSFFYGEYQIKSITTSKNGNVACILARPIIQKIDNKPAVNKPADYKPEYNNPADDKPIDNKQANNNPADNKQADNKPADNKQADNKQVNKKPADNKQAYNKQANKKPAGNKKADNKQADNKPADNKPSDIYQTS